MRKTLLVLGICCVMAAPAWAGGGFSLFGSYSEINDDGQALGAGVRVSMGGERWVGDLSWTWFPSKDGVQTIAGIEDTLQFIPTDFGVRYLFQTQGSFKPYVGGGGTFFYLNLNNGEVDNTWGVYGLLGFSLGEHRAKFFAEVLYRWGDTDVHYFAVPNPITGSMDVGGFAINAGLTWAF